MLRFNDNFRESSAKTNHSLFNESISCLKENLQPELNKIRKCELHIKYPISAKSKASSLLNSHNNHKKSDNKKTILEYSFVDDHNSMKNNHFHIACLSTRSRIYEKGVAEKVIFHRNLEEQRNKLKLDELAEKRSSPELNPRSRKIISDKFKEDRPLYLRYQEEVENMKLKLEHRREILNHEKLEETYIKRSKSFSKSSFDQWIYLNQSWVHKKEAKNEDLKKSLIDLEEADKNLVFTPKLNKTSELIISAKIQSEGFSPVLPCYERLYKIHETQAKKLELKKIASLPSFKPKINKLPNYITTKERCNISASKVFYFEAEGSKNEIKSCSSKFTTPVRNLSRSKSVNLFPTGGHSKQAKKPSIKDSNYLYNLNVNNNTFWRAPVNAVYVKNYKSVKNLNSKAIQ